MQANHFYSRDLRHCRRLIGRKGITAIVGAMSVLVFTAGTALAWPEKTLLVMENPGDFSRWVEAKTIDEPEDSLFSFKNNLAKVVGARWQLSSQPMPNNDLSNNFAGFLGSGSFQPPAQGKGKVITVNWKNLVPAKSANGTKYYFRVVAYQSANETNPLLTSNTVVITIKRSNSDVKFTPKGLLQTVKQKHPDMFAASPMTIELDLQKLYIGNNNENHDEPYLLVLVVYVDGTTINPLALSTSSVRIDCPTKTHGNVPDKDQNGNDLEEGATAKIPAATGHFTKTIQLIGKDFAADLEDADGGIGSAMAKGTAVYVVVIAMEEDNTPTDVINTARATALAELQKILNETIQAMTLDDLMKGNPPKFDPQNKLQAAQEKVIAAVKDNTLTPGWWTPAIFPTKIGEFLDPDDLVGVAFRKFTFGELLAAGTNGIPFELECWNPKAWEGSYTVQGLIRRK
jgi:hypothetical protein